MNARAPSRFGLDDMPIEERSINTIRTLAMDAVQAAESGHPGTPMALAPLAYVLWTRHLRFNPADPAWPDRDRFVLSNGHASMLQYAVLHLTGYALPLEEIRRFRQLDSMTPGHPENFMTPGVETTTGPLGQGLLNSVGFAIAEAHLAAVFNRAGDEIVNHRTWAFCSDGDLMEGASHEAASLAGHLGLARLTWVYDDNHITIEGDTGLAYSDDVVKRFEGYGWHVQDIGDRANDLDAIDRALTAAADEARRPSLIVIRSHIGYGSPNKQDTAAAHGEALGEDEVRLTKRFYGWPEDALFLVPEDVREHMGAAGGRGAALERDWHERLEKYRAAHPRLGEAWDAAQAGIAPDAWDADIPVFTPDEGPMATRAASGKVLNAFAGKVPWLMGGSGDLAGSTKTLIDDSGSFAKSSYQGRNMHWGVREHAMVGACNGMALHGGIRPYAATFFIFTDYARPAIRLSALMKLPVIYVMTHDSIGLGEDGPTHQPIEHLASLRAMPHLRVIRPADANETATAWRAAIEWLGGPTMLVLTRQKLPILDSASNGYAEGVRRGAYVLRREAGDAPDIVLIGTGSEVFRLLDAREALAGRNIDARVVSMPCWEIFREQDEAYRNEILPPAVTARLAVEAAAMQGWREWVGDAGETMGMDGFGASAPAEDLFEHFGFTTDAIVERALRIIERTGR